MTKCRHVTCHQCSDEEVVGLKEALLEARAEIERLSRELDALRFPRSYLPPGDERRDALLIVTLKERDEALAKLEATEKSLTEWREASNALLGEALLELGTIEAITVSPSDTDGLIGLVNRMRAHLEAEKTRDR